MVKRGEIYYADLKGSVGSEQGGYRPVIVIQNDVGNKYSKTLIIAPISTKLTKPPLPTHVLIPAQIIDRTSMVLLEQVRTIDKKRLGQLISVIDYQTLLQIDNALKVSLGIS